LAHRFAAAGPPARRNQPIQTRSRLAPASFDRQREHWLNLRAASAVVNIDQPRNLAKLERRIARSWRKNLTRAVSVISLVANGSVERSVLHLLGQKQARGDRVLDGEGDLATPKMPLGCGGFTEQVQAMAAASSPRSSQAPWRERGLRHAQAVGHSDG